MNSAASVLLPFIMLCPLLDEIELKLKTGATIRGAVVRETTTSITVRVLVRTGSTTRSNEVEYARSMIETSVLVPSPRDEYKRRLQTLRHVPAEHADLAKWCSEHELRDEAQFEAFAAIALDPTCAIACGVLVGLGFVEDGAIWIPEAQYLADRGLVRFQGDVLPIAEAEARRRSRNQRILEEDAKHDLREYGGAIDRLNRRLEEIERGIESSSSEIDAANEELNQSFVQRAGLARDVETTRVLFALASANRDDEIRLFGLASRSTEAAMRTASDVFRQARRQLAELDARIQRSIEQRTRASYSVSRLLREMDSVSEGIENNQRPVDDAMRRLGGLSTAGTGSRDPKSATADDVAMHAATSTPPARCDVLKQSVVLVIVSLKEGRWKYGSGFFVDDRGSLVTNAHVVSDAIGPIRAFWDASIEHTPIEFQVDAKDVDVDLALLSPSNSSLKTQPLQIIEDYELGRSIFAVGFPLGINLALDLSTTPFDITVSRGSLSGVLHEGKSARFLRHDCSVNPGASGGPLVNSETLQVVGVIQKVFGGEGGDPIQIAIPSALLRAFIEHAATGPTSGR